ncbi:MAG: hypothetical protein V4482_05250 [Pseudomonadota bacterium]
MKGRANLIHALANLLSTEPAETPYPDAVKSLKIFFKNELSKYLSQFHGFDSPSKKYISEFLNTKPQLKDDDANSPALIHTTDEKLYWEDFTCMFISFFDITTFTDFTSFIRSWAKWNEIPPKIQSTIKEALTFTEWARKFSPALTAKDSLSKNTNIPSHLDGNIIKELPYAANTIFTNFQLVQSSAISLLLMYKCTLRTSNFDVLLLKTF